MKKTFSTLLYCNISKETKDLSKSLMEKDMSVIVSDDRDYTLSLLITGKIDLLIVDINDDLIEYLKKTSVSTTMLIITDGQTVEEFNKNDNLDYIQKPIIKDIFNHKIFVAQKFVEKNQEYLSLYDNMPECCIIFDKNRNGEFFLSDCNQSTTKFFKETKEELFGKTTKELFPTLFDYLDKNLHDTSMYERASFFPLTIYNNHKIENWLDCNTYSIPSKKCVLLFTDETIQRQAQEKISHNRTFLQTVIDTSKNLIVFFKNGSLVNGNKPFLEFFQCERIEEFLEKFGCISNRFLPAQSNEYIDSNTNDGKWLELLNRESNEFKVSIRHLEEGKNYTFIPNVNYIESIDYESYVVIFNNVTKLEETATTDQLTGCGNRVKFKAILKSFITKEQNPLSIILLDIDHFKSINDTYGHDVGDYVLKKLSSEIRDFIDDECHFCRWGGEEFVLVATKNLEDTRRLAIDMTKFVREINFKNIEQVTISSGVTTFKERDSKESFLKRADNALYSAKRGGRDRVVVG